MISSHLAAHATTPNDVREALVRIDDITDSAARLTRALLGFARKGKNLHHRTSMNELTRRGHLPEGEFTAVRLEVLDFHTE